MVYFYIISTFPCCFKSSRFIRTLFDVAKRCPASIIAIDEPECLYDPGRAREEEYRRARTEFLAALRGETN